MGTAAGHEPGPLGLVAGDPRYDACGMVSPEILARVRCEAQRMAEAAVRIHDRRVAAEHKLASACDDVCAGPTQANVDATMIATHEEQAHAY